MKNTRIELVSTYKPGTDSNKKMVNVTNVNGAYKK